MEFRRQLVEAYREANPNDRARQFDAILLLLQALHSLTRFKGQPLYYILNESRGIALALYHKEKPESQKNKVNKLLLHCLLCFTAGPIRAAIKQMIDRSTLNQTASPDWNEIAHCAELAETMTQLPDSNLPYQRKTTESIELSILRLGCVDHDVPGQFHDADTDYYGFNPNAKKKKFNISSNPHPGAPTLNNPLGVGPPSDLSHRDLNIENRAKDLILTPSRHIRALGNQLLPAQPDIAQQKGAMGLLLPVSRPTATPNRTGYQIGSPSRKNSSIALDFAPEIKQENKHAKIEKVYDTHEMTTRHSSSTNPAASNDAAALLYVDARKNSYSSQYDRRSSPRCNRHESPEREKPFHRSDNYESRRPYSQRESPGREESVLQSNNNGSRRPNSRNRYNYLSSRHYNRPYNDQRWTSSSSCPTSGSARSTSSCSKSDTEHSQRQKHGRSRDKNKKHGHSKDTKYRHHKRSKDDHTYNHDRSKSESSEDHLYHKPVKLRSQHTEADVHNLATWPMIDVEQTQNPLYGMLLLRHLE